MTEFEKKSFSSRAASDEYRDGWEAIFGKKEEEWHEIPREDLLAMLVSHEDVLSECKKSEPEDDHFFGPQTDGSYTMQSDTGATRFIVTHSYEFEYEVQRIQTSGVEILNLRTIITYCSSDRFRAWLEERLTRTIPCVD